MITTGSRKRILKRLWPEIERNRYYKSISGLPHSLVISEDSKRPQEKIAIYKKGGGIEGKMVDRMDRVASEFFTPYNAKHDSFFIVSSDDENDLETANAYRLAAQKKGIEVIKPKNARGKSSEITEGFVRVVKNLNVDPEKSSDEIYNKEFKNLIKLLNFGEEKIEESKEGNTENKEQKTIHILAVGQDDTVIKALQKFFGEKSIKNLEVIKIGGTKNEKKARARFRDETKTIK